MKRDNPELVPEPVPEPARCLSYREMTHLTFYELLQCNVTAHARTLIRQYGRLARIYHPDKGGEPMSFRYLKMAYDVLKDPETRAEYDRDGRGRWTAAFQTDEQPPLIRMVVPSQRVNRAFLKALCKMRGAFSHHIGQFNLHSYLDAVLTRVSTDDVYEECGVAVKLGLQLRLVAKGARSSMPVFPQPRVVRYAAFMGMDVIELDVPSSHGQQALRYARDHGLTKVVMEAAFASTATVAVFRGSLGIPLETAKYAINMLVGGAGLVKVMSKARLSELPAPLLALHKELTVMRKYMMDKCPAAWKEELAGTDHPHLTLGSWHYQLGERLDLDAVASKLPEGVVVHGWFSEAKAV